MQNNMEMLKKATFTTEEFERLPATSKEVYLCASSVLRYLRNKRYRQSSFAGAYQALAEADANDLEKDYPTIFKAAQDTLWDWS